MNLRLLVCCSMVFFIGVTPTHAALMTPSHEAQLESWLGMGDLTFTNIFTKPALAPNSGAFHAAVDNEGPTITLMKIATVVSNDNPASGVTAVGNVIGGYNPQSWNKSLGGHNSPTVRDAFIFNLTTPVKLDQRGDSYGQNQTYNDVNYGPTFGGVGFEKFDLLVNSNLINGSVQQYAYGDQYHGVAGGPNLLGHSIDGGANAESVVTFADIEVYTFAPASMGVATPEPGSLAVMGIGVVGMVAGGRRRRRRAQQAG